MKEKNLTNAQLIEKATEMIPYQYHAHVQTLKELIERFEKLAESEHLRTKTNEISQIEKGFNGKDLSDLMSQEWDIFNNNTNTKPMQKQFLKIGKFFIAIDKINMIDANPKQPDGELSDSVGCEIYQDYKVYTCKISAEEVIKRIEKGGIVINCDPK